MSPSPAVPWLLSPALFGFALVPDVHPQPARRAVRQNRSRNTAGAQRVALQPFSGNSSHIHLTHTAHWTHFPVWLIPDFKPCLALLPPVLAKSDVLCLNWIEICLDYVCIQLRSTSFCSLTGSLRALFLAVLQGHDFALQKMCWPFHTVHLPICIGLPQPKVSPVLLRSDCCRQQLLGSAWDAFGKGWHRAWYIACLEYHVGFVETYFVCIFWQVQNMLVAR